MSANKKSGMNYIDLLRLKSSNLLLNENVNIILNDDIWDKDTLIIKSGGYLTEKLLDKLINFGIKKISVNFQTKNQKESEFISMSEFLTNRCVLIVDNRIPNTTLLHNYLTEMGLECGNIYITNDYNTINSYFRNIKIDLMFINSNFYEKSQRCVDKYSLLRNTHVFVILEPDESVRKLKKSYATDVKFINKPLTTQKLNYLITQAINQNYLDMQMEDEKIS